MGYASSIYGHILKEVEGKIESIGFRLKLPEIMFVSDHIDRSKIETGEDEVLILDKTLLIENAKKI